MVGHSSALQLALEFGERMPVGPLRNDFLWSALNHSHFAEAQCVGAHRVFRVIVTPPGIRDLTQGLSRIVELSGISAPDDETGGLFRVPRTKIGALKDCPQRAW